MDKILRFIIPLYWEEEEEEGGWSSLSLDQNSEGPVQQHQQHPELSFLLVARHVGGGGARKTTFTEPNTKNTGCYASLLATLSSHEQTPDREQ